MTRDTNVHISLGTIVKTILVLGIAALLWFLRDIVLIVLTAVVIASAIEPAIRFFMRAGLKRILAVLFMYLVVVAAFFAAVLFFVPPILTDAASLLQQLPQTLTSLDITTATNGLLPWGSVADAFSSADLLQEISATLTDTTGGIFTTVSAFFGGLASFVLIFVFSFYFSVQDTGVDDFLRIITPIKHQDYVLGLWKRSQRKIGKWMQGQLILALIVGILVFLGLFILGVPHPLLLAVLSAIFELIPVFGPFLAAIPAIGVGFVEGTSLFGMGITSALVITGMYVIIQQFEAHLIYPVVVQKVVGVPPLLVILALIIGYKLVGFLGVLLSVPIAGAIQELVSDIEKAKNQSLAKAAEEG